jgi:ubiquinone biosynthesis protein
MALGHLFRLMRAGFVFAREGVFAEVDASDTPLPLRLVMRGARLIERRKAAASPMHLSAAFIRLGPSYIKLGQFLATRKDVIGPRLARDLSYLQDRVPALPLEVARTILRESFGTAADALFLAIEPAVAAASIAQVHKAYIPDDGGLKPVAVKLLRPDIAARFNKDLKTFHWVALQMERFVPATRRLKPRAVVETLARSVTLEMDLRLEAAALSEIADNTAQDHGFRVPLVNWDRTLRNVLTMDWIDGIPLNDHAALVEAGHDLAHLGNVMIQSFLRHAMRDGFFHADMHPGNLFAAADGAVVAVDFGITGRLDQQQQRFLAEVIHGFVQRDYRRIAQVHFEAGYVPAHHSLDDFATALRAIGEPIRGRSAEQISMGRLLAQLFEVTELFSMETRPELLLLQKTMVVVEGVGRSLNPHLDMWATAEPVAREWMEAHLGLAGQLSGAAKDLHGWAQALSGVPRLLMRLEHVLAVKEQNQALTIHEYVSPCTFRRLKLMSAIALWVIALSMAAIAARFYGI